MKEKKKRKSYAGLGLTCVMTAIAVIYVGFAIYFESHFCFGTSIDGIAVGGSSVEKVENAIRTEMKNYKLLGRIKMEPLQVQILIWSLYSRERLKIF